MQRINTYLLTHHPLLWNLRVHVVWPVILLLHLLFFLAGYTSVSFPSSVGWYALRAGGATVSMGFLSPMLTGVLWLVFYLRNNAFKSFYPLRRGRLAAEAGLIFATCFGLATLVPSFETGAYSHMRSLTTGIDLVRETNVTNLAHHFIPFSRSAFASSNDCNYRRPDIKDAEARMLVEDSLQKLQAATPEVDTFSYLHYCGEVVPLYDLAGERTPRGNDSIAKRWLLNGRQDSVRLILKEYLALCKKYRADFRFDADRQTREIFAEAGFPVRREIGSYAEATINRESGDDVDVVADRPKAELYIQEQRVTEALQAIHEARDGWLDWGSALLYFYLSLGIALPIFSFRITAVRPWFIALIGMGVWCAVFGVMASAFARVNSENGLMVVFMLLSIGFQVAAFYLIREKRAKRNAGVMCLWGLWSLPALLPMFFSLLQDLTRPKEFYDQTQKRMVTPPAPIYDLIHSHWPLIGAGNIVLFLLLLLLVYIPLARRWQAMPEE